MNGEWWNSEERNTHHQRRVQRLRERWNALSAEERDAYCQSRAQRNHQRRVQRSINSFANSLLPATSLCFMLIVDWQRDPVALNAPTPQNL